jgi:hypothetical protein
VGQAAALTDGHGTIVAEFFDAGQSRMVAWALRPQAAALVAALARGAAGRQEVRLHPWEETTASRIHPCDDDALYSPTYRSK